MLSSSASSVYGGNSNGNGQPTTHTLTALKRWSCDDKDLPPVSDVKLIHVYDFDNTLFASPLPNKQLWNMSTIGQFMSPDVFTNGGWWHDPAILASTGEGIEKEEPRAWKGWWNEAIVDLVQLSMQQKGHALNVLLTGRSEGAFADLIKRIVKSRGLDFDMICLKPSIGPLGQRFSTTMRFKQELLRDILLTYKEAEKIVMYEDRPKHTKDFRDFFFQLSKQLMSAQTPSYAHPHPTPSRKPFEFEVIQVAENATTLDPTGEIAEIQRMINSHNVMVKSGQAPPGTKPWQIKRTVFYTGYMIPTAMTDKLMTLVNLPHNLPEGEVRYLANSILITPKPCPQSILDKVGGIGNKVVWRVTGTSLFENRLWAARVEPVFPTQKIYSENPTPLVVLATRRGAKPADAVRIQNWQPVPDDKAFEFETKVGEKVLLRIEEETAHENRYESYFPNKGPKRLHPRDEEYVPLDTNGAQSREWRDRPPHHHGPRDRDENRRPNTISYRGGNHNRGRGYGRNQPGGRGRGGHGRGGGGGGRGRGNKSGKYQSLDDVGDKNYGRPSYDDSPNDYY